MMATALNLARTCGFTVFYWAHDVHLWDGTIPFSLYADSIAPAAPVARIVLELPQNWGTRNHNVGARRYHPGHAR